MSRSRSSKNDWRRYRKFEQENEKLRKEVSKLRRVINNIVIDELEKRAIRVDEGEPAHLPICEICGNEDLETISISRPDGAFEIRICKSCDHRHSMKKVKNEPTR